MKIRIVCPAPPGSRTGNRVTALRWRGVLAGLGHAVRITGDEDDGDDELLVALHARRSARAVHRFARRRPGRPLIVALTGTDLYRDLETSAPARRALEAASRLIVLQPHGVEALPPHLRDRARVIYQSVPKPRRAPARSRRTFDVAVVGHLRPVKDPLRAARAAALLPPTSRARVVHAGAALDRRMERLARAEQAKNSRYLWLGEVPRWRARRLIATSHVLALTSFLEGGANVISEAVVAGTPILASSIASTVAILGERYPGLFPPGDTRALARLVRRAEKEPDYRDTLARAVRALRPLFSPARERRSWARLLAELSREAPA